MIQFVPILQTTTENKSLLDNAVCKDVVLATMGYYETIGFVQPWIGYIVTLNESVVGSAGFKGKPADSKIEIAYGTFPAFQNKGIGTQICQQLVKLAAATGPGLAITARTLPGNLQSISVLKKNNFTLLGLVYDKDDGDVLEWLYSR